MWNVMLLIKTVFGLFVLYYIWKQILRLYTLKNELSWMSGPTPVLSTFDILGKSQPVLTQILIKWGKEFGLTYKYWVGIHPVINTSDPDLAQILSNAGKTAHKSIEYNFFSAFCGLSLLTSAGEIWYRKRKMLTPCFHYEILETFAETMNIHARKLINHLSQHAENQMSFNFLKLAKLSTLDILMDATMGLNVNALENEHNSYVRAAGRMRGIIMTRSVSPFKRNDFFYNFSQTKKIETETVNTLKGFVQEVIKNKKKLRSQRELEVNAKQDGKKKKKALLDMFLDMVDNGTEIPDDEIESEVNTFIFAGHDTASAAISYTIYLIGRHPEIQETIYQEVIEKLPNLMESGCSQSDINKLEYLDRCIKESLRMYPPIPIIGKLFKEPMNTDKGLIPANVNINQNIYSMHHNEKIFPQPNIFNPDRFLPEISSKRHPYSFIPFGSGPRNCIGQKYALNEVKILLSYLIINYKIESIQLPEDLNIGFDIVLTPFNGIHIKIQHR